MTTDLEVLARRAVACRHWRWMPGMRWVTNDDSGRCDDYQPEYMARPAGALPDFDDAATLGCLLSLVREAWHEATTQIDSRWWVAARDGTPLGAGATEAAALVAALEAAP